jgi:hypothetical protein
MSLQSNARQSRATHADSGIKPPASCQNNVRKDAMSEATQTDLQEIFTLYKGRWPRSSNLHLYGEIATRLSKTASRPQPWTWRYIQSVARGTIDASAELSRAVQILAAEIDGQPATISQARAVQVIANPDRVQAGALIMGESKQCKHPPCMIVFVPTVPWQEYCPLHKLPKNRK